MKIMRENDVKIFEELVKMEQSQLLKTLFTFLTSAVKSCSCFASMGTSLNTMKATIGL